MKIRVLLSIAILLTISVAPAFAQVERGTSSVSLDGAEVAVEYGRPVLAGRDMLGMATVGMEWRMGADAATTLKTSTPLQFGDLTVPAGTHELRARKTGENSWSLSIGTLGEVPLKSTELEESVEQFTIELGGSGKEGNFSMKWGTLEASTPFKVQ